MVMKVIARLGLVTHTARHSSAHPNIHPFREYKEVAQRPKLENRKVPPRSCQWGRPQTRREFPLFRTARAMVLLGQTDRPISTIAVLRLDTFSLERFVELELARLRIRSLLVQYLSFSSTLMFPSMHH